MKPLTQVLLLALIVLAPLRAHALTLTEAVDRAERNYPSQQAAEEAVRQARLQLKGVYWGLSPAALVSVVDSHSQSSSVPELPPGTFPPMTRSFTTGAMFSISNIWQSWFKAKLAKANVELQEQLAAISGSTLAITVVQAYASFVAANAQLADCVEFKSAISSLAEAANNEAISAGVAAIVTQLESIEAAIRVQRLRASDTLVELISENTRAARDRVEDGKDAGKKREAQFSFSDEIPAILRDMPMRLDAVTEALPLIDPDQAIGLALKRAPMLLAAGYNAEVAQKSSKLAWISTILPNFDVNATSSQVGTSIAGIPLSQRSNGVAFNLTWTFGGKNVVDKQVADSAAKQARLKVEETERTVVTSVKGAYRTVQSLGLDIVKQQTSFNSVKTQFDQSKAQLALMRSIAERLAAAPALQAQARALAPLQNKDVLAVFVTAVSESAPELKEDAAKLRPIGDLNQLSQLIATGLENWAKLYEELLGYVATAAQIHMYTGDLTRLGQVGKQAGRNPVN